MSEYGQSRSPLTREDFAGLRVDEPIAATSFDPETDFGFPIKLPDGTWQVYATKMVRDEILRSSSREHQ